MFSLKRDFIHFQDKIVEVIRSYPEDRVKDMEAIKEWLDADTVLRREGRLYFCVTIQEAEIIEDEALIEEKNSSEEISE